MIFVDSFRATLLLGGSIGVSLGWGLVDVSSAFDVVLLTSVGRLGESDESESWVLLDAIVVFVDVEDASVVDIVDVVVGAFFVVVVVVEDSFVVGIISVLFCSK